MATPKIRLKGFEGEWFEKSLGEIAQIYQPPTISESVFTDKGYEVYGANGIIGYYYKYNHETEQILVACRGSKCGVVNYSHPYSWINGNAMVINVDEYPINKLFMYTLMEFTDFSSIISGSGQPQIVRSPLQILKVNIPSISEQAAIASYFKSLDNLIQATAKKIESLKQMKQASLISMFPQEGETVPKVRFKGFEGDWKKVKLSSIAKRITRKNSQMESTLPLTISSQDGLIAQTAFFNHVVASANVSGYYLLKKGEFAYNKSYSNGYPFGSVKRLDKYEMGVLSTLYIVFSIDKNVSSDYIVHFFDTSLWYNEVAMRAAEGARNHGLLNIGAEDFLDIEIMIPKYFEEQESIANYFNNINFQISLQSQRLEKLKQIKAECLNNMFV